ncbi:hypothetical protein ACIPY6_02850 [Streptomyces sp. NPDC090054]|uniref:hypothetical protein n=1 Tax=Streptomyces sp. NPDC090054 TaxID=3365933 RepID=UPI003827A773
MAVPDARVELQIGGAWVDTEDDLVHADGVRYSWGRRGEGSQTDPSSASFSLLNPTGKYSGRNPLSPYFGQLGRNTRVRLTHDGADVALYVPTGSTARATTPDHASLDITGDLDLRAEITPSSWSGLTSQVAWELAGKYAGVGQRSWLWVYMETGRLQLWWSADGTNLVNDYSALLTMPVGSRAAVRTTLDVNNGLGGWTATHYTAPSMAGPWTQVSQTVTTSGTTSIFNSTSSVEVGDVATVAYSNRSRLFHSFEMRSGIGGTVVAAPDFSAQASGTTSFVDSAGRTWSAGAGQITSRRIRAVLEGSEWTPKWGASGHDVTTPVEAGGVLRRLGQGDKPLASTLRRRVVAYSPVAYWPLEDGRDAVQAASPIPGVQPLAVSGLEFAADDTCPGSAPLPRLTAASSVMAPVPASTATGQWLVSFVYLQAALPASDSTILDITTTGSVARLTVSIGPTYLRIRGYSAAGATVLSTDAAPTLWAGPGWHRFDLSARDVGGGDVEYHMGWISVGGGGWQNNTTIAATPGTVSGISTVYGADLADVRIGHLSVWSTAETGVFSSADSGYDNETAAARVVRLAAEEGLTATSLTAGADTTRMGPQRAGTLLDLLDQCEAADGGILHEDPETPGLMFRGRTSLFNQPPKLTIPYGQLAPPLSPIDDDQRLRNDRTVGRIGGSSARAVLTTGALSTAPPPAGVGVYDDSQTLNLYQDSQCADIASWLLHRGTWNEARYPQVTIYLHKYPSLIPAVTALRPGDIIRITDLPPWLPPGPLDLMVEGATEVLKTREWTIVLACSPGGPWTVAQADTARADTDGSVLGAAAGAGDTTMLVHTLQTVDSSNPRWTQDPAELPFDVTVGGEVVRATAISGLVEDVFGRTVAAGGWGTSTSGQTYTVTGGTASERSVSGGLGLITVTSSQTTLRVQTVAETCADAEVRCTVSVSATATGAGLVTSVVMRWASASSCYRARVEWGTGGGITLSAVVGSTLIDSSVATGLTYTPGAQFDVRVRLIGHRILMRIWPTGGVEPVGIWQLDRTATSGHGLITSGQVGVGGGGFGGNTNPSVAYQFDNWAIESPQRMAVTRAINGIVKPHAVGADVRLTTPAITSY